MPSQRLSILALASLLAGCATMKIQTEFDPTAPFPQYKTFGWLNVEPGPDQPPAIRSETARLNIKSMVEKELSKRGLTRVQGDASPDLLVWLTGSKERRVEVATYGYTYAASYAYGYGGIAMTAPVTEAHTYTEGTLLLDLVDARSKQLVWRGSATDTLDGSTASMSQVNEALTKILAHYPPKPQ